jgi:hypothetical protein
MASLKEAPYIKERTECPICFSTPEPLLDLGNQFIVDFLDAPDSKHIKVPLEQMFCPECHLFMLRHVLARDRMYRRYWYRSGSNSTMVKHLESLVEDGLRRADVKSGDVVVDIGSNDGTTLSFVPEKVIRVGFEPSNLAKDSMVGTNIIKPTYFSVDAYRNILSSKKAKLIISTAMFYDLPSPQEFVGDISQILLNDGVWLLEMNYLGDMLKQTAYDFICHEHVNLYFISTLNKVLRPEGLIITDIAFNSINGGSVRAYIQHGNGKTPSPAVDAALLSEYKLRNKDEYRNFATNAQRIMAQLKKWVGDAVLAGEEVVVKGASTRGMTTLQASGLDKTLITKAHDINPDKFGKVMAGLDIPIVNEADVSADTPGYKLVLPWGFLEQFKKDEKAYLERGGKLIVAFPEPVIITG